jgi:hypothetical protein
MRHGLLIAFSQEGRHLVIRIVRGEWHHTYLIDGCEKTLPHDFLQTNLRRYLKAFCHNFPRPGDPSPEQWQRV